MGSALEDPLLRAPVPRSTPQGGRHQEGQTAGAECDERRTSPTQRRQNIACLDSGDGSCEPHPDDRSDNRSNGEGSKDAPNEDAVEGAAATGDRGDRPQGSPLGQVVPQRVKQESAREQDARGKAEQDDPLPLKGTRC